MPLAHSGPLVVLLSLLILLVVAASLLVVALRASAEQERKRRAASRARTLTHEERIEAIRDAGAADRREIAERFIRTLNRPGGGEKP